MPLPVNRSLWEAKDAETWQIEFDECLKERAIFGVTSGGDLMKLQQTLSGMKATSVSWEKWLAGQDCFGSMVMTAASLL
jgi:hypothetical protein